MEDFNIIEYLSSLTSFVFDKSVLKRVAMERGVFAITDFNQITQKQKDLCLADLLYVIYSGPNYTANMTLQHGAYTNTVGSQRYDTKKEIYNIMIGLYKKWADEKMVEIPNEGLQWVYEKY